MDVTISFLVQIISKLYEAADVMKLIKNAKSKMVKCFSFGTLSLIKSTFFIFLFYIHRFYGHSIKVLSDSSVFDAGWYIFIYLFFFSPQLVSDKML